jgi:hypothetical protein
VEVQNVPTVFFCTDVSGPARICLSLEGVHLVKSSRFGRNAAIAVIAAGALALTACGSDNATNSTAGTPAASGPKVTGTLTGLEHCHHRPLVPADGVAADAGKVSGNMSGNPPPFAEPIP